MLKCTGMKKNSKGRSTHGTVAQTGLHGASHQYLKLHSICSVSQTVLSEQSRVCCADVELWAVGLHPYYLPREIPMLLLWLFAFLCQHFDVRHCANVSLYSKHPNALVPDLSIMSLIPKLMHSMQTVQLDRARHWTRSMPVLKMDWTCPPPLCWLCFSVMYQWGGWPEYRMWWVALSHGVRGSLWEISGGKRAWWPPVNIQGLDVDIVDYYKYLKYNKLDWAKITEVLWGLSTSDG